MFQSVRRRPAALLFSLTSTGGSTQKDDVTPGNQSHIDRHFGANNESKVLNCQIMDDGPDTPAQVLERNMTYDIGLYDKDSVTHCRY